MNKESEVRVLRENFEKNSNVLRTLSNKIKSNLYDWAKNPYIMASAPLAVSGLTYGAGSIVDALKERKENKKTVKNINKTIEKLISEPEFSSKKEKAIERMGEIASIAPSVAANPLIVKPVLRKTITKGLDTPDIKNIVEIEYRTRKPKTDSALSKFLKSDAFISSLSMLPDQFAKPYAGAIDENLGRKLTLEEKIKSKGHWGYKTYHDRLMDTVQKPLERYEKNFGKLPEKLRGVNYKSKGGLIVAREIIAKNPELVEEIFSVNKRKQEKTSAAITPALAKGIRAALGAAAVGAGFGITQEAAKYIQTNKENKKIKESWKHVQERLKKMEPGRSTDRNYKTKENMEQAETIFKSLSNFAPAVAKDPVLGASIVNNIMVQSGNIEPATLKTLVEIQKGITQSQDYRSPFSSSPFMKGVETGFGVSGGPNFIGEAIKSEFKPPKGGG